MDNDKNNRNNEDSPKKGFMYWWINVFMYHYFKYTVLGIAILILVVTLTIDAMNKTKYDFSMVIAAGYGISEDELLPLMRLAEEVVGDLDGDGQVNIDYININLNSTDAINQYSRFELSITDSEFLLIFMDGRRTITYGERGDLDDLSYLGFDVEEDRPYRIYVGDAAVFADFEEPEIEGGASYEFTGVEYAVLQTWKAKGKLGGAQSEAAVRLLQAIVDNQTVPAGD